MNPRTASLLLALALPWLAATAAGAQNGKDSGLVPLSLSVPSLTYIDVTNSSVTYPSVAASHFDTGWIGANASSSVTHRSNVTHSVLVKSSAATMTATGSNARSGKPASDLQLRVNSDSWTDLSTTDRTIVPGAVRGSYTGGVTVQYRVLLDWALDTPGTYTLGFVYTVVPD